MLRSIHSDSVNMALYTPSDCEFQSSAQCGNDVIIIIQSFWFTHRDSQHIQASWSVDSLVVSEKATDQDLGPAGEITYDITHGNENQFFRIDESGDVRVASSPLLPGEYQLTITALDHGTPPFSTSGVLTITVEAVGQVDCGNSVDYGETTQDWLYIYMS